MIEKFNGSWFLMMQEFDGLYLIRAFLIEMDCVYLQTDKPWDFLIFKAQSQTYLNFAQIKNVKIK